MEFPKMTTEQKIFNDREFKVIVENVRRINSGLADMLMQNRNTVDRHVTALESELNVMEHTLMD